MGNKDEFSTIAGSTACTTNVFVSGASAMPSVSPSSEASAGAVWSVPARVKMYEVRTELPESHVLGIGRIMVQWSLFEWLLQQVLFDLTTGDPKIGRISVGFPRSEEAVSRIVQLATTRNISLKSDTDTLKREARRLETYRDQVGHGIWVKDDTNRWCVVVYKGSWEAGEWQGVSKRVTPHAKPVDDADLAACLEDIKKAVTIARALGAEVSSSLRAQGQVGPKE